jgi:hypothetical protein
MSIIIASYYTQVKNLIPAGRTDRNCVSNARRVFYLFLVFTQLYITPEREEFAPIFEFLVSLFP